MSKGTEPQLSDRQLRERTFYEHFAAISTTASISFGPVAGKERRPWNSYWRVYELVMDQYRLGARRLLDFGCGNGAAAIRFAHVGYDVKGFDIAPSNIASASHLARQHGVEERTEFSVQAAESLDYPDETFDVVVGFDILHHVEIRASVSEALRLLKTQGLAIFREHLEVPLVDRMRNTRLIRRMVPNQPSFDMRRHISADERKLTFDDIGVIRGLCHDVTVERFNLCRRLDRFIRRPGHTCSSLLERLDYHIFRLLPALRNLGDGAVLLLRKGPTDGGSDAV